MTPVTADTTRPSSRRALALVLLLALVLQLPTLGVGFFADDYVHQLVLEDEERLAPTPRWSLFDFGTAADWAEFARERSALPWWTSSDWKVRFFRPLASVALGAQHALFGRSAVGYHATSLVLWLALLVLARRLYLALGLAPRVALGAVLVLAVADSSSIPVGWIANQNALWEALCAVAALLCALRPGASPGAIAAALALAAAAALSKESGAFAFPLLALTWMVRRRETQGAERARLSRAALAAVALFAAYLSGLVIAGYGTRSRFYATPWLEPLRTLENLAVLAVAGVQSFVGPVPLDVASLFPETRWPLIGAGLLLGLVLAPAAARALRGTGRAWLLAVWTAFFLVPQGGVVPSDRLLFGPTVGVAGVLALTWSAERAAWSSASRPRRVIAWLIALSVVVGSAASLAGQNRALADMARHVREKIVATDVGDARQGRRDVLILQAENEMQAFCAGATWHAELGDDAVHFWNLQGGPRALRWTRTDERTFELEALDEPFLTGPFELVYRSGATPPAPGARCATPLFVVEPLESGPDGLRRFRVTLERPLDDPSLVFVRPVDGVLTLIVPPAPGEMIELERAHNTRPFTP